MDMKEPMVILVNENDEPIGVMEKLKAHQEGKLHRAISVVVVNSNHDILLQKRAAHKYHLGNKWSNTCCSLTYPHESPEEAAIRRLNEEMVISIHQVFLWKKLIYKTALDNNLIEHELDYVYIAFSDNIPHPNPVEVSDYAYVSLKELKQDIQKDDKKYTYLVS